MTKVFRRSDTRSLTYYCKIDGKRIALHENKATAQQLALGHAARIHREKNGLDPSPAARKEPKALEVISEYLRTRNRFAENSLSIINTNTKALFGDGAGFKGYFGNICLSTITDTQIHALVAESLKSLSYATVKQRVKYLRFFAGYAVELGYLRPDQCPGKLGTRRYLPKEHKREVQVPTREEFDLVFQKLHPRFQPYVMTLLCTGARRMELASAKVSWVAERNGRLWLSIPAEFTKTRSARTTPILPEAEHYVRAAMHGKQPQDFLFEKKPKLLASRAGQSLCYWVRKLGIKNKFVLHTLRALFIVNLNVKGVPISQVALWAGQNIQICFQYCRINKQDSEALLEKAGL